jgi:hypothetical protein
MRRRLRCIRKVLGERRAADQWRRDGGVREALRYLHLRPASTDVDVLAKLVVAAEHLLRDHDCDVHGWEVTAHAARVGRERLEALGLEVPHEDKTSVAGGAEGV